MQKKSGVHLGTTLDTYLCPFDSKKERPQGLFWMFEEVFVRHSLKDQMNLCHSKWHKFHRNHLRM